MTDRFASGPSNSVAEGDALTGISMSIPDSPAIEPDSNRGLCWLTQSPWFKSNLPREIRADAEVNMMSRLVD